MQYLRSGFIAGLTRSCLPWVSAERPINPHLPRRPARLVRVDVAVISPRSPPRPPRVMVPPTPRREIPASIAPPDPRCHRFRKRLSRGVKGGRRPRCRGSKSKKHCKTRRKLRGPTSKLGFGTDARRRTQCERCDQGQHTKCRRLRTCFARSPPGVNRRQIGTRNRSPDHPRSPRALLTPAGRGCAARRSKRDAKKATATAQLEATTQVMVNLSLNPTGGPNGSTASFLQLTELALAATSVLLAGAHPVQPRPVQPSPHDPHLALVRGRH